MATTILFVWATHISLVSPETAVALSSALSVFPDASVTAADAVSEISVSPDASDMTAEVVS